VNVKGTVFVCLCLFLFGCCGYSVRALLPPHLKTIAVLPVENQTIKPGLDVRLTDSLVSSFRRDGSLRVVDPTNADIVLHCEITSYDRTPQSYTSGQEIKAWQVSLSSKVECTDQVRSEKLWEGPVSSSITYDAAQRTEDDGIAEVAAKLAAEIVRRTLIAW
jgi:hypothetical protein